MNDKRGRITKEIADAKNWLLNTPSSEALAELFIVHVLRSAGGEMPQDDLVNLVHKIVQRIEPFGAEIGKLIILGMINPVIKDGELALCPTEKGIAASKEFRNRRGP